LFFVFLFVFFVSFVVKFIFDAQTKARPLFASAGRSMP
jgi:hypothetical protein